MSARNIYLWRAFTMNRTRICDCGIARATSREEAESIAWMCLGGPHKHRVVEIQIEIIPPEGTPGAEGSS